MGAGASAEVAAKMAAASVEDLAKEVGELPMKDRAKLLAALGDDAPFLKMGFQILAESFQRTMKKATASEHPDVSSLQAEMGESLAQAAELWTKSFDHHDKTGDGVLDPEEASAFFAILMREAAVLLNRIADIGHETSIEVMKKRVAELVPQLKREATVAEKKEAIQNAIAEKKKGILQGLEDYKGNQKEYNKKAFEVMDTAGNGVLSREEFLDTFKFGTEQNFKFFKALGVDMTFLGIRGQSACLHGIEG